MARDPNGPLIDLVLSREGFESVTAKRASFFELGTEYITILSNFRLELELASFVCCSFWENYHEHQVLHGVISLNHFLYPCSAFISFYSLLLVSIYFLGVILHNFERWLP